MSGLQFVNLATILFAVVLVTGCLLVDHVTGSPASMEERGLHRYPRAKYRVGYMFGKRASSSSSSSEAAPSLLFDIISRDIITKEELESLTDKNRQLLSEVVAALDKNDDGYISLSDFM
ncbi:unnamed protein product [Candidula unifasciata]|uniref:EF-hand domain-containing protein n=1 Tax=Candidula unifasciata TaxID=100452 RepID=A0A8S3Z7S0_9EUPU|nr:unnamed protein product [Candidula unifasciata]